MKQDPTEQIIAQIEAARDGDLEAEDRAEVELWSKGRSLRQIVGTDGWDVAMATLASFPKQMAEDAIHTNPADVDLVRARQAAAYAATEIFEKFVMAITNALEASNKTPRVLKQMRAAVPPESL